MPLSSANASLFRYLAAAVLLFVGGACVIGTDEVVRLTRYDQLSDATAGMLDANINRDMKTFLAVSGIKAGMGILTGSTVEAGLGLGVELQVGDAVQPVFDYIDFVWNLLLYALMVLGFYKLLMETGLLAIGLKILGVGLAMWALSLLFKSRYEPLRRWGRTFAVLGLLLTYVVPAALWGTQYLSNRYTERLKEKHYAQIETFRTEFDTFKERALALRGKLSVLRPAQSVDEVKTAFLSMSDSLVASSRASLMAFMYYILIILFELLFLPFLSAFFLYKFLQAALDELLGTSVSRRQHQPSPVSA